MSEKSTPKKTEAYIARAADFARPICEKIAALVRRVAPELREEIKWGCPVWSGKGMVFGLGAFKAHVSLNFFKGALVLDPEGLFPPQEGTASMRSLKITSIEEIRAKAFEKLIRASVKVDAEAAEKPAPKPKRAELPLPEDLAKAIRAGSRAQTQWDTLPPSCRREYIEWVTSAKREETRTRRLAEAVRMIQSGRRRNEEYR